MFIIILVMSFKTVQILRLWLGYDISENQSIKYFKSDNKNVEYMKLYRKKNSGN